MSFLRRHAFIWVPVLLLAIMAAPSATHRLPNYESELGENYQPLRALKFFASGGHAYHKYGPMPNFLLGPGYALSMAWWWADGSFEGPDGDFPYGLKDPIRQISWLLLHGRILFMVLFLLLSGYALVSMRRLEAGPLAIALGFAFCISTNYAAAGFVANTRPDGPMFAFALASMGVYVRILSDGLTRNRGILLSALAVLAISCKEIAATIYILPYLWLGWRGWRDSRSDAQLRRAFMRSATWAVAAGVTGYMVLNVVYAPTAWLQRMEHWFVADGIDSSVWGGLGSGEISVGGYLGSISVAFLNTLGPAGVLACAAAILALIVSRPARDLALLLPAASLLLLGLFPLGYTADRFYVTAAVTLVPPVILGLQQLLGAHKKPVCVGLLALLAVNAWWSTFAWHRIADVPDAMIEEHLSGNPPNGAVNMFDAVPRPVDKSRLTWLGYDVDERSIQQLTDSPDGDRPKRIYATAGMVGFINDALRMPARAEMLEEHGLDMDQWSGLDALGYERVQVIDPETPVWFPFDWMPAVQYWRGTGSLYVYEHRS